MSRENVGLLRASYDAFNRRDLDANLALMDDDVQGHPRAAALEGTYQGHDGMRRWWKDLLDAFPDMTATVGEALDLGDLTVAAIRLRGRGAGSETPSDQTVWHVSRWQREKCVWWAIFDTQNEALEAARGVG
jgi:ketosteroid isomerase-like protein